MKKFFLFFTLILIIGSGIYFYIYDKKNSSSSLTSGDEVSPSPVMEKVALKVYFGKQGDAREGEDCKPYSFVERSVVSTIAPEKEALEELLKGPSDEELKQGYYSSINKGVKLQSLIIEGGKAKADFSQEIETGVGGSCKVLFIRQQIEKTLMEFDNVREVEISVNGRTEDILQP